MYTVNKNRDCSSTAAVNGRDIAYEDSTVLRGIGAVVCGLTGIGFATFVVFIVLYVTGAIE